MLTLLVAWQLAAAPAGTVLRLPFDGDTLDADGSGLAAHAPGARYEPGRRGQALRLGRSPATIADAPELRLAPGLRIDGWIRFESDPAGRSLVTKDREYMLRVDPAREGARFSFFCWLGEWEPRVQHPVRPVVGRWYHWEVGWDGATMSLTIDNQTVTAPRAGRAATGGAPVEFGPFDGLLDEVTMSNPNAEPGGVAHWAFDGDLRDDAGGGHHLAGDGRFQPGRRGQAARIDSPLSTPDHPALRLAPGLRIDCVVRFDALPASYGTILIKDGEYQLRVDSPQEGGRFSFFVNLGGWEPRVQVPVRAEVGVWYRLSARWDGLNLSLDVNGRSNSIVRSGLAQPGEAPLVLPTLTAAIDDLRIDNPRQPLLRLRALTQAGTLLLAGRSETLRGTVENLGSPADAASATMLVGPGVELLSPATIDLGAMPTGASRPVEWTVRAPASVSSLVGVQLAAGEHRPPPYHRVVAFLADPAEPRPPVVRGTGTGTTFYVDAVAGDNGGDGLSPAAAWRDATPLGDRVLGPGDRLLIRRGSVLTQELRVTAHGTAEQWAEIGAYGEGARPMIRGGWDIADRCAWIRDPDFLRLSGLTFAFAGKGLVVQYSGIDRSGLVIEDCLAHHIEGLYRTNAHGIPEWQGREPGDEDGLHSSAGIAVVGGLPRDVLIRDCEVFACSWGFFVVGDNVTVDRVYCHDNYAHNTSPHPALVAVKRSFLQRSVFDASGWHASAGTMGIMLVDPQGLVIRDCTFRNQPDSGSHDEGAIDFENSGNGCLIDRCTFQNNAGAAIEVLGLQTPQPRDLEFTRSRFIRNNVANKLGPAEVFIWGRSTNPDVVCSNGTVHGNAYTTLPGVEFFVNEQPTLADWTVRDNTAFPDEVALRAAMPLNDPPAIELPTDLHAAASTARLTATIRDSAGTPTVRWEQIDGPASVTFASPNEPTTDVDLPVVGDYLLRLVADDGELWTSRPIAVHRLPAGSRTARAWGFGRPLDGEGWTSADLGTQPRDWPDQDWPTRSEPVDLAAGGFWVVTCENSRTAALLSPDNLDLDCAAAGLLRLRLQNSSPATRLRVCFATDAEPTFDPARSATVDISPGDRAPRVYDVALSARPGFVGKLKQIRIDLAVDQPLTGTFRLDDVWLGAREEAMVKVILDTDMSGDCDDAGALALLHALADAGEVSLLATVVNRLDRTGASAAAVEAINTYYGRGHLPIGTDKVGPTDLRRTSLYAPALRDEFAPTIGPDSQAPDALDVYRRVLAEQPDGSVTIASIGALSNLAVLLREAPDLVRAKVARLVVMGGQFPDVDRPETNIRTHREAAREVAAGWPGEIIWHGWEVGEALITGSRLKETPRGNPVRRAYELRRYGDRPSIDGGQPSYDQAAALYAVRGAEPEWWRLSEPGRVVIDDEGRTRWQADPAGRHRFVSIAGEPAALAALIEALMVAPPVRH